MFLKNLIKKNKNFCTYDLDFQKCNTLMARTKITNKGMSIFIPDSKEKEMYLESTEFDGVYKIKKEGNGFTLKSNNLFIMETKEQFIGFLQLEKQKYKKIAKKMEQQQILMFFFKN